MYLVVTTARLVRLGISKREIDCAQRCCIRRIARGRYVVDQPCGAPDHRRIWAATDEGYSQDFDVFDDRRDAQQSLRALIRARAELVAEKRSGGELRYTEEIFSHVSAALIHSLPIVCNPDQRVEVVRHGASRKHRHLQIRNTNMPRKHVTSIGIYRVTSLERTLVDIALTYDLATAVAMIDHALYAGLTTLTKVEQVFEECEHARARRRARNAFALGDSRRESPAESVAAVRFYELGIKGFELQVEFVDSFGHVFARADFCHRKAKLIVEVDGLEKYSMGNGNVRQALEAEKTRDARLASLGYRVVHLTWKQLFLAAPFEDIKRILTERLNAH